MMAIRIHPKTLTRSGNMGSMTMLIHSAIGRRKLINKGSNRPRLIAAFSCVSFCAEFCRTDLLWRAYSGSVRRWLAPLSSFRPRLSMPPNIVESIASGYSTLQRINHMKTQSTRANTAQNPTKTALFPIFWHRQTVCQNITGTLALRFKRRFPDSIVKFSGFEGGAI